MTSLPTGLRRHFYNTGWTCKSLQKQKWELRLSYPNNCLAEFKRKIHNAGKVQISCENFRCVRLVPHFKNRFQDASVVYVSCASRIRTSSVGKWYPTLRDNAMVSYMFFHSSRTSELWRWHHYILSKHQSLLTQWRNPSPRRKQDSFLRSLSFLFLLSIIFYFH